MMSCAFAFSQFPIGKYHASAWDVFVCSTFYLTLPSPLLSSCQDIKLYINMAEKEVTVYIVDVGKSMGERRQGRSVMDLDWAMRYVWDRITATVYCSNYMSLYGC